MADGVRFELTVPLQVRRISSAVPSTTRPPVRRSNFIHHLVARRREISPWKLLPQGHLCASTTINPGSSLWTTAGSNFHFHWRSEGVHIVRQRPAGQGCSVIYGNALIRLIGANIASPDLKSPSYRA